VRRKQDKYNRRTEKNRDGERGFCGFSNKTAPKPVKITASGAGNFLSKY
jgi:hypothetical protein